MKKFYAVRYFLLVMVLGMIGGKGWGQNGTWGTNSAGTWLTTTNWVSNTMAGSFGTASSNSGIATFNSNASATVFGINMNNTGNGLNLGSVFTDATRSTATSIGNSSTTVAGNLRLYGATVNSVSNVIIRNAGTGLLTIQGNQTTSAMGTIINNVTDNIINIDNTGGVTISSIISGSGKLTKAGSGSGVLLLSGANIYTGATTLTLGTLRLGVTNAIPVAATGGGVILNGGILSTGASTGFSDGVSGTSNMGTLTLSENSTIALGTGSHSLFFAASNATSWTAAKTITISGWTGTAGSSGTAGKIFVGSTLGGLTTTQLAQISFSGYNNGTTILSNGEVVPAAAACSPPSISSVTPATTSASLAFTCTSCNPGNAYVVEYGASGFTPGTGSTAGTGGTVVLGTASPVNIPSLTAGTTYDVYIRQDCSAASSGLSANSTKATFTTFKIEPTNQPTAFATGTVTTTALPLTWTAAVAGSQAPDGYLLKLNTGTVTDPVDGTDVTSSAAIASGSANLKVSSTSGTFTGATPGTMYYVKIYSFTNATTTSTNSTTIDYKLTSPASLNYATLPNPVTGSSITPNSTSSATITWTLASGYSTLNHSTLVFIKAGTSIIAGTPTNAPSSYNANTAFAAGTPYQGDASAYCVYNGDATSVTVTGLSAATTYTVIIYTVVDASNSNTTNSYSTAVAPTNATTLCAATSVPYTQNFESVTVPAIPSCTSIENAGLGNNWGTSSPNSNGFTSKTLQYSFNSSNAANAWFYTQGLNLTAGVSYRLSYRYGNNSTTYVEKLKVALGSGASSASMSTVLANHSSVTGGTPTSTTIDFIPPSTGIYYIGFNAYSAANQYLLFVDDINIDFTPTCIAPSNSSVTPATNSASLAFTCTSCSPGNSYIVEYGASGFTPGTGSTAGTGGTVVPGNASPVNIPSLTSGTSYDVYIRQDCSSASNGYSANSTKATFTTLPACATTTSPAANATGVCSISPTFTWTAPAGGAPTGYKFYLGTDGAGTTSPTTLLNGTILGNVLTYTPNVTLASNTIYYWQVVATNATGSATNCAIQQFTSATYTTAPVAAPVSSDFECINEWVIVNGSQTNKWTPGTATASTGSKSLYVSNTSGTTNAYVSTTSTVHFYKDVTFPQNYTGTLSFDWKGAGELNYDRILVFVAPTTVTPVAGTPSTSGSSNNTALSGASLKWTQPNNSQASFVSSGNIALSTSDIGNTSGSATVRIIFTWQNDGSTGTLTPAGAIDNISITATAPPTCAAPVISAVTPATTSASLAFVCTSCIPGNSYIVEYGAPGFTPGAGSTAGTGGTVISGTTSPIIIPSLTASTTYDVYIRQNCSSASAGYSANSTKATFVTAPANDDCSAAATLTVNFGTTCTVNSSGTTVSATQSQTASIGNPDDDVWYSFVATANSHTITVTPGGTGGISNIVLESFGGNCGSLTSLGYTDVTIGTSAEAVTLTSLTIGNTYYVRVYSSALGSGQGAFTICATTPAPVLTVSPTSLTVTGFNEGFGPLSTATSSFTISGSNLTSDITVAAPAEYEISTANANGFTSTLTFTPTLGSVSSTTIYVRLRGTLLAGTYNSKTITISATGATSKTVSNSGTIYQLNNDCVGAIALTVNSGSTCTVSTTGNTLYTTQSQSATKGNADDDVWYSFVATATSQTITATPATSGAITDIVFEPFSGTCGNLTSLGPVDGSTGISGTVETTILSGLTVGAKYYVRVYSYNAAGSSQGAFTICASTPPACVAPSAQPTSLNLTSVTTTGLSGAFTAASPSPDGYIIVRSTAGTLSSNPIDGTAYASGASLGGGTVIQAPGTATTFTQTGLSSNTTYYYFVFSYNNTACGGGPKYLTSLPLTANATTLDNIWTNPITGTNPNTSNPYTNGQTTNSNIAVSGIGRGTGINSVNSNDRYNANGWISSTFDANDYFTFTLTPNEGYKIDFSSFVCTASVSGTGPSSFAFRSSADNYTANIGNPTSAGTSISLSNASYQGVNSAITFRLYGYGASDAGGTFSVNDFNFIGSVNCLTPAAYAITGGGTYCASGTGVPVGLSNSQTGVNYQLILNGTNTGSPVAGTGSAISFGNQTAAGTYTIAGINSNSTCNLSTNMTGSATITINPLPTATISGTATVCQSSASPVITFTGTGGTAPYTFTYNINGGTNQTVTSQSGSNPVSVTVAAPTGSAGGFIYNLVSVAGQNCSQAQSGSATITVNPLPTATITGTATVCESSTSPLITFTGTGGTAPYTFTYNINGGPSQTVTSQSGSNPVSVTVAAPTGSAGGFTYNLVSVAGQNCLQAQSGSATVTVNPATTITGVTPASQSVCKNATPADLVVTAAGTGTFTYQWHSNTTNSNSGGTSLGAANGAQTNTYTPVTTDVGNLYYYAVVTGTCGIATSTGVLVTVNALPDASVTGNGLICSGSNAIFTITATNANSGTVSYHINTGSTQTATISGGTATVTVTGATTNQTLYLESITNSSTTCSRTVKDSATVAINSVAPSVNVTQPDCSSATGAITVTAPTGTGITYSIDGTNYQAGTTFSGLSSGSYSVTAKPSSGSCTSPANPVILAGTFTWMGTSNSDWSTAANWSCGSVPTANDNAVIPSTSNKPLLVANTTINGLTIQAGANIRLNDKTFTINGDVSGNGTLVGTTASSLVVAGSGTSGIVYFNQNNDTTTNTLQNLTVSRFGNITIGNKLYITDVLNVTQGTFNTGDNIVLRSTSKYGTARVAPVTGSIQGNVTVERFMDAARSYRLVTPAVQTNQSIQDAWMEGQHNATTTVNNNNAPHFGTHITGPNGGAAGYDETATNNPSLYTFNESTQKYEIPANTTTSGALVNGKGYRLFIRGDRSINLASNSPVPTSAILRVTGTLNTGDVTLNTTSSPALATDPGTLPSAKKGYALIGNPYASPVSWETITISGDVNDSYYAYDPHINARGAYVNYSRYTHSNSNPASSVSEKIQSGQAFFVQTVGPAPSIVFHEANKVAGNTNVFRTSSTITALSVRLLLNTNPGTENTADGTIALFDSAYSRALGKEDSYKLNNQDENIAIAHDTTDLSIEGRPNVVVSDTIQLKIWQYRQKSYLLRLDGSNFAPGVTAFVKDAYLNAETPVSLSDSTLIPFSLTADSASFAENRFMIVFKSSGALPVTITDVKGYQKGKGIQVDWISRTETNIDHYEIEKSANGQQFEKSGLVKATGNNSLAQAYGWFDESPLIGANYYRIKVVERSGAVSYTRVVKVTGDNGGSMTVYPNPVKGNAIKLHLVNMQKGRYTVTLYNTLGQKMLTRVIDHDGTAATYTISTGRVISKGSYRLHASNGEAEMNTTVMFE